MLPIIIAALLALDKPQPMKTDITELMITNADWNVQTIMHESGFIPEQAKDDEAVQHAPL